MQYTINFDMKGQFRLEKDLNSKEKHIIILLLDITFPVIHDFIVIYP